jgi:tRNA modification GTPase
LSKRIASFQKQLTEIAAIVEASVDFPEEGLEFATLDEIIAMLEKLCGEMRCLQKTFHEGRFLHEGISLCLLGSPNVGKSSLMNALLGKERAIVTNIPGTTRDLLEEELRLFDLHFRLIDTAGIRTSFEPVEQEGIRRSRDAMQKADLILLLLDASRPLSEDDRTLFALAPPDKTIVIWNKIDLSSPPQHIESAILISAEKRLGFDSLRAAIQEKLWKEGAPTKDEVLLTQLRHYQALTSALDACRSSITALQTGTSPEFTTSDLRSALHHLGAIIGTNVSEDILSAIFSKFCLGK